MRIDDTISRTLSKVKVMGMSPLKCIQEKEGKEKK